MLERTLVLVDTSYLLASFYNSWEEGARGQLEISLATVVRRLDQVSHGLVDQPVQRQNWYDGIPDSGPHRYQRTLRVIEGVQLRPGQLIEWGDRRTQKAVDTLLVADMIQAAYKSQCSDMVLVTGDADMIPGVRVAVDAGVRVHLVGFGWDSISSALRHACDTTTVFDPRADFQDAMQIRVLEGPVPPKVRTPAARPAHPGDDAREPGTDEAVGLVDVDLRSDRPAAVSVAADEARRTIADEERAADAEELAEDRATIAEASETGETSQASQTGGTAAVGSARAQPQARREAHTAARTETRAPARPQAPAPTPAPAPAAADTDVKAGLAAPVESAPQGGAAVPAESAAPGERAGSTGPKREPGPTHDSGPTNGSAPTRGSDPAHGAAPVEEPEKGSETESVLVKDAPTPGSSRPSPSMMAMHRRPLRSKYVPLSEEVWTSSGEQTPFDVGQQYATWWFEKAASEQQRDQSHLLSGGVLPPHIDRPLLQFACQMLNEFTLTELQRVRLRDGFHEGIRAVLLKHR